MSGFVQNELAVRKIAAISTHIIRDELGDGPKVRTRKIERIHGEVSDGSKS